MPPVRDLVVPRMRPGARLSLWDIWNNTILGPRGCWLWTGRLNQGGYGVIYGIGRTVAVHRLAYQLASDADPAGRMVLHRCDERSCCNPAHLYLGTAADNVRDKMRRHTSWTVYGRPVAARHRLAVGLDEHLEALAYAEE